MNNNQDEFNERFYDEDEGMNTHCPDCGREYDEIDYEYQICTPCKKGRVPEFLY